MANPAYEKSESPVYQDHYIKSDAGASQSWTMGTKDILRFFGAVLLLNFNAICYLITLLFIPE